MLLGIKDNILSMKNSENLLIQILKDKDADWSDRHDAALDLSNYYNDDVVSALLEIAQDSQEDDTLLATCGESLGLIWINKEELNPTDFFSLTIAARDEALSVIHFNKPDWITQYQLDSYK